MRFKKLAVYSSLALSTTALITIIYNQKYSCARFEEQQETITSLENEIGLLQEQFETISISNLLDNAEKELLEEAKQNHIDICFETEKISIYGNDEIGKIELSDDFYFNLNQIMTLRDVNNLLLYHLGNEIDFSKVNLSTIKNLSLNGCKEGLDCSSFTQKYDSISFEHIPTELAIRIVENCDCSNATIYCSNIYNPSIEKCCETFIDVNAFANYLVKNNISMKSLYVQQWSYFDDCVPFTMETIDTLSHVNTKALSIVSNGNEDSSNLNLALNKNIQYLYISLPKYVNGWIFDVGAWKLEDIKISSENPFLNITFEYGHIHDKTHFDLPASASVQLLETVVNDTNPFYDLSDVQRLKYTIHPSSIDNSEFAITYDADTDNFDDFIEELKYFWSTKFFEFKKK